MIRTAQAQALAQHDTTRHDTESNVPHEGEGRLVERRRSRFSIFMHNSRAPSNRQGQEQEGEGEGEAEGEAEERA